MRFEGHHLSVNLTFAGDRIVSATPLFLGANPETVPRGPDKGLRALAVQVDAARRAMQRLSGPLADRVRGSGEWFGGFLTNPGSRRAELGNPAGAPVTEFPAEAQEDLRMLIRDYIGTMTDRVADPYVAGILETVWPDLHFYWSGGTAAGDTYYWRLQGGSFLLEHDGRNGGTHIHAVWRDTMLDFGGVADTR